jgi:hypothetical protein
MFQNYLALDILFYVMDSVVIFFFCIPCVRDV